MSTATYIDLQREGDQCVVRYAVTVAPNEVASLDITPKYIVKTRSVTGPCNFSILTSDNRTVRLHNYPITLTSTVDSRGAVGLKDLTVPAASAYSGNYITNIRIVIASGGNTFDWYRDGVLGASGVSITGANQTLTAGIVIKFGSATGHTANDVFQITFEPNPAKFEVRIAGYGG